MPAITFLALLAEGHKLDVYEKKMLLTIALFPHMDEENREIVTESLVLPEDIFDGILEEETPDGINTLKDLLNNGD